MAVQHILEKVKGLIAKKYKAQAVFLPFNYSIETVYIHCNIYDWICWLLARAALSSP